MLVSEIFNNMLKFKNIFFKSILTFKCGQQKGNMGYAHL